MRNRDVSHPASPPSPVGWPWGSTIANNRAGNTRPSTESGPKSPCHFLDCGADSSPSPSSVFPFPFLIPYSDLARFHPSSLCIPSLPARTSLSVAGCGYVRGEVELGPSLKKHPRGLGVGWGGRMHLIMGPPSGAVGQGVLRTGLQGEVGSGAGRGKGEGRHI